MSGSIHIKVTTEVLTSVSGDVTQKINKVQKAFDEIDTVIRNTTSYWEGDGNNQCREYYKIRQDDYERILRDFKTHIENLQQIAVGYKEVEEKAITYSSILPEDVIV